MNDSFAGKVALVTGAGSGIGLATAKAFGEAGASVVLADRREDAVRAAAEGLSASGGKALAVRRVDTAEISGDEWDRVMAINLRGVWSCMKYELPQMLRNGGGAIVNCSSIGGVIGVPGLAAYHAAKHGVIGLTKTAALEYATRKIRIDAVCPGTINTPMAESLTGGDPKILAEFLKDEPIGRIAEPEEVAAGVLWLCSPGASYVVGNATDWFILQKL